MSVLLTYLQAAAEQIPYVLLSWYHAPDCSQAFQPPSRTAGGPPADAASSQIDRALPQVSQRAIQALDSASIEAAQERGTTARISF